MEAVMTSLDSFKCCRTLKVGSKTYAYYSLPVAEKNGLKGISRLPFSLKVSRPPAGRTRPAINRSRLDLPAPFRPVTSSASPPPTENPRPANTSRPPRTQASPPPSSRMNAHFVGGGVPPQ